MEVDKTSKEYTNIFELIYLNAHTKVVSEKATSNKSMLAKRWLLHFCDSRTDVPTGQLPVSVDN